MSLPVYLVLVALGAPLLPGARPACASPAVTVADSTPSPSALWRDGITFGEFSSRFKSRKADWEKRNEWGAIPDALAARMRALTTPLRVLIVAEEECSDSMNSMPYLVRLVQLAPNIGVRVVDSKAGRSIMEAHRTPDGRAATPTVVVLDAQDRVIACWVERPSTLIAWLKTPKDSLPADQRFGGRLKWYENDKGTAALAEWVPMFEQAAAGRPTCGG